MFFLTFRGFGYSFLGCYYLFTTESFFLSFSLCKKHTFVFDRSSSSNQQIKNSNSLNSFKVREIQFKEKQEHYSQSSEHKRALANFTFCKRKLWTFHFKATYPSQRLGRQGVVKTCLFRAPREMPVSLRPGMMGLLLEELQLKPMIKHLTCLWSWQKTKQKPSLNHVNSWCIDVSFILHG